MRDDHPPHARTRSPNGTAIAGVDSPVHGDNPVVSTVSPPGAYPRQVLQRIVATRSRGATGPRDEQAPGGEQDREHDEPVEPEGMAAGEEQGPERTRDDVGDRAPASGDERPQAFGSQAEQDEQEDPGGPKFAHASPMRPGAAYPGGTWSGNMRG